VQLEALKLFKSHQLRETLNENLNIEKKKETTW
jgi:hypothetical protein